MTILINGLFDLDYDSKKFYSIEFRHRELYNKLVNEFYILTNSNSVSKQILVFDGEKEESLNKKAYFVSNYFEYNIRSKQILTRVFRLLEDNINLNHELKSQFLNKTNEMIMILDEALKDINIDFIWEEEISIFEFFKALGLKVNISDTDSIYQKLLSFLDVVSELQLYKLIIFPNIKLFFSEKQLEEIFKYALYRRIKVLCLDSAEHKKLYSNEIKIIVDEFYDIDIKEGEKLDP